MLFIFYALKMIAFIKVKFFLKIRVRESHVLAYFFSYWDIVHHIMNFVIKICVLYTG